MLIAWEVVWGNERRNYVTAPGPDSEAQPADGTANPGRRRVGVGANPAGVRDGEPNCQGSRDVGGCTVSFFPEQASGPRCGGDGACEADSRVPGNTCDSA